MDYHTVERQFPDSIFLLLPLFLFGLPDDGGFEGYSGDLVLELSFYGNLRERLHVVSYGVKLVGKIRDQPLTLSSTHCMQLVQLGQDVLSLLGLLGSRVEVVLEPHLVSDIEVHLLSTSQQFFCLQFPVQGFKPFATKEIPALPVTPADYTLLHQLEQGHEMSLKDLYLLIGGVTSRGVFAVGILVGSVHLDLPQKRQDILLNGLDELTVPLGETALEQLRSPNFTLIAISLTSTLFSPRDNTWPMVSETIFVLLPSLTARMSYLRSEQPLFPCRIESSRQSIWNRHQQFLNLEHRSLESFPPVCQALLPALLLAKLHVSLEGLFGELAAAELALGQLGGRGRLRLLYFGWGQDLASGLFHGCSQRLGFDLPLRGVALERLLRLLGFGCGLYLNRLLLFLRTICYFETSLCLAELKGFLFWQNTFLQIASCLASAFYTNDLPQSLQGTRSCCTACWNLEVGPWAFLMGNYCFKTLL